jgi:hypothetical protein
MIYRFEDDGLQWQKLAVQWNSKATAEHATGMAIIEEGSLSTKYQTYDRRVTTAVREHLAGDI